MDAIAELASSLGRRDEIPNRELADKIVRTKDTKAVAILVQNLQHKKTDIQNDCIKVLYEIGAAHPKLIANHLPDFIALLRHKNNRMQWGAMTALHSLALEKPADIFAQLPLLIEAAENGSVITKDNLMALLTKLYTVQEYADDAFALLNGHLLKSLPNQLPMYAENASSVIREQDKTVFIDTLKSRLADIEKDSKRKRIEKVIQKLSLK